MVLWPSAGRKAEHALIVPYKCTVFYDVFVWNDYRSIQMYCILRCICLERLISSAQPLYCIPPNAQSANKRTSKLLAININWSTVPFCNFLMDYNIYLQEQYHNISQCQHALQVTTDNSSMKR